jgi:hypothetical protein
MLWTRAYGTLCQNCFMKTKEEYGTRATEENSKEPSQFR